MNPIQRVDFARLFEQLKLSLNKQKEIITLIGEIARREDISIRQVLACDTFQQILTDEDLDRGQKGRKIRSFLRQRRFPRIVKAEQNYHAHLKKLKLNPDIKLIPPKEFEGTTYTLEFKLHEPCPSQNVTIDVGQNYSTPQFREDCRRPRRLDHAI